MNKNNLIIALSPAHIIVASFFILILCGTALLSLPFARTQPAAFIDLFFTATSATCVTGLFTIPFSSFTFFGKSIILALVQIGALGLATMSLFILSLFMELGIATKSMVGQLLEVSSWQDIKKMLVFISLATLITELIGALLFLIIFASHYPLGEALYYSLFHSVSSFCNAGISFLHDIKQQNLEIYNGNYLFIFVTSILMFLGGIGFITWKECILYLHSLIVPSKPFRFSLHSKIILYSVPILLMVTACIFWALEHNNTLSQLSFPQTIANTIFHAISFKSCGFFIVPFCQFHAATLFLILLISIIGSSPGSTGSGIKITTFVTFLCIIKATLKGRESAEAFGRQIPLDQAHKALTIISLSIGWILFTTFCLLITETEWSFFEVFFEAGSAFSNLGASLAGSDHLSFIGKLLIIATMLIGRIGSLTFILGLKLRTRRESSEFSYPEERVILG